MMKVTKRGRPYLKVRILSSPKTLAFLTPLLKDTLDLFATLVVSLELISHKQFFRTFANSFTTSVLPNLAPLNPPTYPLYISFQRGGRPESRIAQVFTVKSRAGPKGTFPHHYHHNDDHLLHDA